MPDLPAALAARAEQLGVHAERSVSPRLCRLCHSRSTKRPGNSTHWTFDGVPLCSLCAPIHLDAVASRQGAQ